MSVNPFVALRRLLPPSPVWIGRVIAHNDVDDTSTLELPTGQGAIPYASTLAAGSTIRARGRTVPVGQNAFVRDGVVETQAPEGTPIDIPIGRVVVTPSVLTFSGPIADQAPGFNTAYALTLDPYWLGGQTPRFWSIASGTLPTGLSLNTNTGVISGTVDEETAQVDVSILCTDYLGATATGSVRFLAVEAGAGAGALLLHFDGAEGATTTTDSSPLAHTVTLVNGAKLSTTSPKFGTACLLLDGSNDYASIPYHAALHHESGDFTVECQVNTTDTSGFIMAIGDLGMFGGSRAWSLQIVSGKLRFAGYTTGSGSAAILLESTTSVNTGTYVHVAATRAGNTFRLFVNGALEASGNHTGTFYPLLPAAPTPRFVIGGSLGLSDYLTGRIDEVRIVSGEAVYTSAFTPPTGPFA